MRKILLVFFFCSISNCFANLANLEKFVSYDNGDKELIKNFIEEVYRRYPDTKSMNFENSFDNDFLISLIRSVLAEKVYKEYKYEFIQKFKEKSARTDRPIMGYIETNEKGHCFKNGKCTNKLGVSEIDFDNEIANLPNTTKTSSFHLYNGKFDTKDCWYKGDAGQGNICDISDELEDVGFHIAEDNGSLSGFNNSFSGYLRFEDTDSNNNTYNSITVSLDGNSTLQLDSDSSFDYILSVFKEDAKLSDKKNKDKQDTEYNKMGFREGKFPKTKYDKEVYNAPWVVDSTIVEIVDEYRKSSKGDK